MSLSRTLIVLVFLLSFTVSISAQKTDVVTLANGDRITGEVSELSRGRLELKTDDAGTIDIEWEKLARVESIHQFEVILSDGSRLLGSLGRADAARFILVIAPGGNMPLAMMEVTNITPIGKSFWAKLDGSVDAGFTYTRSSGIATTTLNTDTLYRRPSSLFQLSSSATVTHNEKSDEPDDRASLDFSYIRYRGRRLFGTAAGRLESNESLGLLLRSQAGAGLGLRMVNTNRAQLGVGAGVVVNNEQGLDTEATQNVEALFTFNNSYYAYDRPKTNFDTSFQYFPSLSDWGRQRLQLDTSARRELWKDFFVSLNMYDSFDTDPPDPDSARNDVGITASVGWSF